VQALEKNMDKLVVGNLNLDVDALLEITEV